MLEPHEILLLQDAVRNKKQEVLDRVNAGHYPPSTGYQLFLRLDGLLDKLEAMKDSLLKRKE